MKITCGKKSRLCKVFISSAVFALYCAAAQAQPQQHRGPVGRPHPMGPPHGPPSNAAPHGPPPGQSHGQPAGQAHGPSGQSVRDRWLAMPPEARQNFRRNAELWMQMTPEQRNLMRQRENIVRHEDVHVDPDIVARLNLIAPGMAGEDFLRQRHRRHEHSRNSSFDSTVEKRISNRSARQKSRRETASFAKVRQIDSLFLAIS